MGGMDSCKLRPEAATRSGILYLFAQGKVKKMSANLKSEAGGNLSGCNSFTFDHNVLRLPCFEHSPKYIINSCIQ